MEGSLISPYKFLINCFLLIASMCLTFETLAIDHALVIRGKAQVFDEVLLGIRDDLENELTLIEMIIDKDTSDKNIDQMIDKNGPRLVILMGNKAVNLYAKYQANHASFNFPPAIAIAALFIDEFAPKLKNTTAIRYEIPAVTSVVSLRSILDKPIKRIGVVYRKWMREIIEENRKYCEAEGIELIGIELPNKVHNLSENVKAALNKLNAEVDVLWILNDNSLLTKEALINTWIPNRKESKLPAIVGIKQFVSKIKLGSFAVVPDNYALGAQAAGMIFEIKDNNWLLESTGIQHPVSIKTFINIIVLAEKGLTFQPKSLNQVDEIIE